MKKIGILSVIALMGMSSVYAADYRASINNAIPKSNVGFQWNNFTKMTGVKWENPQPKASPQKNADGTLTYYMMVTLKELIKNKRLLIFMFLEINQNLIISMFNTLQIYQKINFFQKSLANLVDPNQLTGN